MKNPCRRRPRRRIGAATPPERRMVRIEATAAPGFARTCPGRARRRRPQDLRRARNGAGQGRPTGGAEISTIAKRQNPLMHLSLLAGVADADQGAAQGGRRSRKTGANCTMSSSMRALLSRRRTARREQDTKLLGQAFEALGKELKKACLAVRPNVRRQAQALDETEESSPATAPTDLAGRRPQEDATRRSG